MLFQEVDRIILVVWGSGRSLLPQTVFFSKMVLGTVPGSRCFVIWGAWTYLLSGFLLWDCTDRTTYCGRGIPLQLCRRENSIVLGSGRLCSCSLGWAFFWLPLESTSRNHRTSLNVNIGISDFVVLRSRHYYLLDLTRASTDWSDGSCYWDMDTTLVSDRLETSQVVAIGARSC